MIHVVLVEPQIPPNTGNIARLCAAMQCHLHLVGPLGFSIEDKYLKRAGLDYWPYVKMSVHESLNELRSANSTARFFYLTTRSKRPYTSISFSGGDFLVFGNETKGLPRVLLEENRDFTLTIPMSGLVRSLNLSSTVAIVVGEAMRQLRIEGQGSRV